MGKSGLSPNPCNTVKHYVHTKEGIKVFSTRTRSWQMFSLITEAGRISGVEENYLLNALSDTLGWEIHRNYQPKKYCISILGRD